MHITDEQFWKLTGKQLSNLIKRFKRTEDRRQMQVGIIASTIANFSMCHPKEPLTVSDFMPNKKEKEKTNIEIAESIVQLFPFISIPRDNN